MAKKPAATHHAIEWLSIPQAAKRLGVSPRTLRRAIDAGRLPVYRTAQTCLRIKVEDLDALVKRVA